MSDSKNDNTSARQNRVRRLKRLILATLFVLIATPIICCIVLLVKVNSLNHRVDQMAEKLALMEWSRRFEAGLIVNSGNGWVDADGQTSENDSNQDHAHRVYLTFDDGPSSSTDEILDILAKYNVKATFFVVGKEDEKSQAAIKRIVAEGHTLGMHSYSHKYSEIYDSKEAFVEDFTKLSDYLENVTGEKCSFYRFPGGSSNTVSKVDMNELADYLEQQQVVYFDWNISSQDASNTKKSVEQLVRNCTSDIGRYEDAVILLHDSADKKSTVEALPQIIESIQAMDDTVLLPITDTTEKIQHVH